MLSEGQFGAGIATGGQSERVTPVMQAELLGLLFKGLPRGLVLTLINALLTAFLVRNVALTSMLAAWTAAMVLVIALRAVLFVAYTKKRDIVAIEAWQRLFVYGAALQGFAWGSAAFLLLPADSVAHQVFIGFVLAGMAAGAMASLVFDRLAYAGYVLASVGPYALSMIFQGTELQIVMGVLGVLFIVAMLEGGRTFRAWILENLALRLEKEAMAGDLRIKAEEQVSSNLRLKAEFERASAAEDNMRLAKEQAVAASRAKSTFLANMSHEIRTPINGVLGMTDLLMRTSLDDRQKQLAQTLRSSGSMLLSIIEDVLDISRIEAGKLAVVSAPYNPRVCCEDALALLRPMASQKKLDLVLTCEAGLPEAILGDGDRIRQVVVNLVGNAVKFTSSGQVEVKLGRLPGERLRISVIDTGIGIEATELERIMQPFEQADASINRRYGGTGLGLAISKHLIGLMGGQMQIRSTAGQGTEVEVDLPMEAIERRTVERSGENGVKLDGLRVLLAEDNPVNQMIAQEYLIHMGCVVDTVENGNEAVAAFRGGTYDIVLMDCQMPEMDGLAATMEMRRIETASGARRTPIVAVTANAFEDDRDKSMAAGMDAHLSKPYSAADLEMTLLKWGARSTAPRGDVSGHVIGDTRIHRLDGNAMRSGKDAA